MGGLTIQGIENDRHEADTDDVDYLFQRRHAKM